MNAVDLAGYSMTSVPRVDTIGSVAYAPSALHLES